MLGESWFILISTVLVNNLVLTQFLGLDPALSASRSLRPTLLLCAATSAVLVITSLCIGLLRLWLPLDGAASGFILIVVVLVTAVTAAGVDRIARDIAPLHHRALGHHLPLLFCNSAILGSGLALNQFDDSALMQFMRVLATMLAFSLAMIMVTCLRERLAGADVPEAFRGIAITVMTLGLLSLAFTGFSGMAGT